MRSKQRAKLAELEERVARHKARLVELANVVADTDRHNSARRESAAGQREEVRPLIYGINSEAWPVSEEVGRMGYDLKRSCGI